MIQYMAIFDFGKCDHLRGDDETPGRLQISASLLLRIDKMAQLKHSAPLLSCIVIQNFELDERKIEGKTCTTKG
jgi:hypothetical protein